MEVSYGDFAIGSSPTQPNDNLDHSAKNVRQRPTDPPGLEDPTVDENGMKVDGLKDEKRSWKDKLVGIGSQEINNSRGGI